MSPSAIPTSTSPTVVPSKEKQQDVPSSTVSPASEKNVVSHKTPLQMISQGTALPGIPTFVSFAAHRTWMLEHMALAFRVFARKGYTEGMSGHISVRDPENSHTFWTNVRNNS